MPIRQLTEADVEIYRALRLLPARVSARFHQLRRRIQQRTLDSITQQLRGGKFERTLHWARLKTMGWSGMVGFYRENALKLRHKGHSSACTCCRISIARPRAGTLRSHRRAQALPDLKQLLLGVVVTQTTAKRLYESLGFVVYGREPRAVKISDEFFDEEFMLLKL